MRLKRLFSPAYFPIFALVSFALLARQDTASAHTTLLPKPQQVQYGATNIPIEGLTIHFANTPTVEDDFAANQMAARLSAKTQQPVEIGKGRGSRHAIVLNRTGNGSDLPADGETTGPDSRESYFLKVTTNGVEIRAPSSTGLFYGVQTLLQLVETQGARAVLPECEIHDWPALAYRSFMMDFSHGQLLRVSEIERQLDELARFKANQYFFYSELSIEYEGYELVNPDGRYTRDEIRHIIDYARQRHIDVVPCMELYGHMHDLFRVEKFADVGLPRYGDEFDPRNPHTLEVIDDLLAQTVKLFPSPWVHVGFDEPWSLGKIGMVPGKDPFQTFADVLKHIATQAQRHGRRIIFWADIMNGASTLSNHPELVRQLPGGVIAAPWEYEAVTNYAPFVEPLAKVGVPTLVTPAIWNWNEVFPDYHRSFANINGLVQEGLKEKTLGVLNTGWTDCGQTLYRQSLPGLAFGAIAGWQPGPIDTNTFFGDYCALTYPPNVAAEVAPAFEELSTAEEMFEKILDNATQHGFWQDPLRPSLLARLEKEQQECRKARLLAETAQEGLMRAQKLAPNDPTLPSLLMAARLFDYLGMKCLYAVEWADYFRQLQKNPDPKLVTLYIGIQMNAQYHSMLDDLMDTITNLREPYRELYLTENAPYRVGTVLDHWDGEIQFWHTTWHRVNELLRTRKKDEPFPSIDFLREKH